jgi:hypothetical protein
MGSFGGIALLRHLDPAPKLPILPSGVNGFPPERNSRPRGPALGKLNQAGRAVDHEICALFSDSAAILCLAASDARAGPSASSPEDRYIAIRDAAVDRISKLYDAKSDDGAHDQRHGSGSGEKRAPARVRARSKLSCDLNVSRVVQPLTEKIFA